MDMVKGMRMRMCVLLSHIFRDMRTNKIGWELTAKGLPLTAEDIAAREKKQEEEAQAQYKLGSAQAWSRPDFWKSGNPEIWNLESQKSEEHISKSKYVLPKKVGKVWIGREKNSWPHLGTSGPIL